MNRLLLLLLPLLGLTAAAAPAAEMRSKSFCRDWARSVADRNAGAGDVVVGTALGAFGGALIGAAVDGQNGAGKGALIGAGSGAVLTGVTTSDRWQHIYRRAYAECRAS